MYVRSGSTLSCTKVSLYFYRSLDIQRKQDALIALIVRFSKMHFKITPLKNMFKLGTLSHHRNSLKRVRMVTLLAANVTMNVSGSGLWRKLFRTLLQPINLHRGGEEFPAESP